MLPAELLADRRLGHAAVRVACALWSLATELADGRVVCTASRADLAKAGGVSVDAVDRATHRAKGGDLVLLGWVVDAEGIDAWELRRSPPTPSAATAYPHEHGHPRRPPPTPSALTAETIGGHRRSAATAGPSALTAYPLGGHRLPSLGEGGGMGGVGASSNSLQGDGLHDGASHTAGAGDAGRVRRKAKGKTKASTATLEHLAAVVVVLDALGAARKAADWPAPHGAPAALRRALEAGEPHELKGDAAVVLRRLLEVEQEDGAGIEASRDVLVAIALAKVDEHRHKDGGHATGQYAVVEVIYGRKMWWPANLAAGRAWLVNGGPGHRYRRGGAFVPRGEYGTT